MSEEELERTNEDLRRRLEESEDTIQALRAGRVDAVLVNDGHPRVYTLDTPDKPHRLLVDQHRQPAVTVTVDGTILYSNRRFASLVRRPVRELKGRRITRFVTPSSCDPLKNLMRRGRSRVAEGEIRFAGSDPKSAPTYLRVKAIDDRTQGQCLLITDQSDERYFRELQQTQEELRALSEGLQLAQEAGRVGTFDWDIRTGVVRWSDVERELFGVPQGKFGGRLEDWAERVHPEDRVRAQEEVRRAVAEGAETEQEFRVVLPDGRVRWLMGKARVITDDDGTPVRMVGVNIDITRRKEALAEAEDDVRKKDEFLATLAHELTNPLAPIRNGVEILKNGAASESEHRWAVGVIDRQVLLMGRLLEDLLDVSRVSRRKLELRLESVTLESVIEAAIETSRPSIEASRHELRVELPEAPIYVKADPVRLSQVFANLLNNAAKYTEPGGEIRLSARGDNGEAVVSVRDSGIGISADMLPRLFDIFSQESPSRSRTRGGLGIGLSLVKGLVELHGGSVEAHSRGPGAGSEFVVRLPASIEAEALTEPAQRTPERPPATKRRILVVDDSQDSADTMTLVLEMMGHEIQTAYDGEAALRAAAEFLPEVILLDIGMPGVNGYEVCGRIRDEAWGAGIRIVALTGWGQDEDRRRAREAGFDDHIVKPADPAQLEDMINSLPRD